MKSPIKAVLQRTRQRYLAIYSHCRFADRYLRSRANKRARAHTIHVICYSCYSRDLTALSSRADVEALKCLDNDHLAEFQRRRHAAEGERVPYALTPRRFVTDRRCGSRARNSSRGSFPRPHRRRVQFILSINHPRKPRYVSEIDILSSVQASSIRRASFDVAMAEEKSVFIASERTIVGWPSSRRIHNVPQIHLLFGAIF